MNKNIDKKIKTLFEYQKFENNPKLSQTIMDTLKQDQPLVSDMELLNVTGGKYIEKRTDCPNCGAKQSYVCVFDTDNKTTKNYCIKCKYPYIK